jgi:EAL domain-containing protein (putative c-di-GMP-specific phosphodiesterase class I)
MQPVLDKRGKIFGYEAFARMETNEKPIGGGQIIEAGRHLNAEYMLDRYLHLKAIRTFISSDLGGFLFINLIPGFIHRPEKYLEGLTEAAKFNGMPSKQIVLDFTKSETPRDISHLKAIFDYCRSHGYLLSLDDISSVAMAKKILETVKPDFIKLDIELVRSCMSENNQRTISELVSIAHTSGATLIAEGVENAETHNELLKTGVDLFQGYFFSPPVAVSQLKNVVG